MTDQSLGDYVETFGGGWVCEQHPDLEWPHDDCEGPGMPWADAHADKVVDELIESAQ